jgi:6-phosphogluconolactonase
MLKIQRNGTPLVSQQRTSGAGPCHISMDHTQSYVLVANYESGSVAVLPVLDGGHSLVN